MKTTISLYNFRDAFASSNSYSSQFSYAGLEAIFDHLTEYEESTGEEMELDIVSIACEYTEYESLEEFHQNYDREEYPDFDSIESETIVLYTQGNQDETASFIVQNF